LLFVPDKDKFDKNTWLSDVLGHKDTDIATAASYTVINVIKRPVSKVTEKLQVNDNSYEINLNVETLQNQINKLKEEVKAEKVEKTEEKEEKIKFTGNREQKEEQVKKIYKQMKTNKELISIRRVMAKSGVSQRIVVETLNTVEDYVPNTFNTVK
jgi:deoxyxylulose-5-phosphate synthase